MKKEIIELAIEMCESAIAHINHQPEMYSSDVLPVHLTTLQILQNELNRLDNKSFNINVNIQDAKWFNDLIQKLIRLNNQEVNQILKQYSSKEELNMKKCDACGVEHITIKCDVISNDKKVFEDANLCFDCRTKMRLAGSQVILKEKVV